MKHKYKKILNNFLLQKKEFPVSKKYQEIQFRVQWLIRCDTVYLTKATSRTLTIYEKYSN